VSAYRKHRLAQKRIKTCLRPFIMHAPCQLIENTASLRRGLRPAGMVARGDPLVRIENTASLRRGLRLPRPPLGRCKKKESKTPPRSEED